MKNLFKILSKPPPFHTISFFSFSKSKPSSPKTSKTSPSLLSFFKQTVKNSLQTESFGLQTPKSQEKSQQKSQSRPHKTSQTPESKHLNNPHKTSRPLKNPSSYSRVPSNQTKSSKHFSKEFPNDLSNEKKIDPIDDFFCEDSYETPPTAKKPLETPENTKENEYFSIDFLQFPWNFQKSFTKPTEGNLKSPVSLEQILYENEVISIIKNFLLSIEDFDYETLKEIIEPFFFQKLAKNMEKMQKFGFKTKLIFPKKKPFLIDIFNVHTVFAIGLKEDRLKNDGNDHFDVKNSFINDIPCENIVHKSMNLTDNSLILLQISCFIDMEVKFEILNEKGEILKENKEAGKNSHILKLETVLLREDYESLSQKTMALQKKELDVKKEAKKRGKLRFYIIDFDDYMLGNPLIH